MILSWYLRNLGKIWAAKYYISRCWRDKLDIKQMINAEMDTNHIPETGFKSLRCYLGNGKSV